MGYNIHDINNGIEKIQKSLDDRAKQKGEALANEVLYGNLLGFMLSRWTNFLSLGFVVAVLLIEVFQVNQAVASIVAIVAAFFLVRIKFFWYMKFRYAFLIIVVIFGLFGIRPN